MQMSLAGIAGTFMLTTETKSEAYEESTSALANPMNPITAISAPGRGPPKGDTVKSARLTMIKLESEMSQRLAYREDEGTLRSFFMPEWLKSDPSLSIGARGMLPHLAKVLYESAPI